MASESLSDLRDFAAEMAWQAGKLTLRYFQTDIAVESKADDSPVTVADRQAERMMREMIEARYPAHSILGEEEGPMGRVAGRSAACSTSAPASTSSA